MKILDLSAGNRAVWFNKAHPMATFVDIRPEVAPDVVADSRALPASLGSDFDLVVFDPPHVNFGANAQMSKTYGEAGMRSRLGRWLHSLSLWAARWIAPQSHRVCEEQALVRTMTVLRALTDYTYESGHLTRAYHAGRRLRTGLEEIRKGLDAAKVA